MKQDLIEKIDISLEKSSDYREMTILTLQSAKEVLQIYMNLENDYITSQRTLDNEIASFKDRTQEVKDKIDEFYNSSSITLEQVKQAEELCESIKEQVINYSSHIDEIQDKIESDKQEMSSFKTQNEDLIKQTQGYRDQIIGIRDEINGAKTDIKEDIKQAKETFENNLKLLNDSISDFNSKLEEFKNQISVLAQKEKAKLETQFYASKDEIATLVQNSKEDIEKTTTHSQQQIQKLLKNVKKDTPVTIDGTEVTVVQDGDITYYKFQEGVNLENVDFIDKKAINDVLDKIEKVCMLSVKNGLSFTDKDDKRSFSISSDEYELKLLGNSSFKTVDENGVEQTIFHENSLSTDGSNFCISADKSHGIFNGNGISFSIRDKDETKIPANLVLSDIGTYLSTEGFTSQIKLQAKEKENNLASTLEITPVGIEFYSNNGLYVNSKNAHGDNERKKILLEGDTTISQTQNYLYSSGMYNLTPNPPLPQGEILPENYAYLTPFSWKYKTADMQYYIKFEDPNFGIFTEQKDGPNVCNHAIVMGDMYQGFALSSSTDANFGGFGGINISHTNQNDGIDTSEIKINSGITLTYTYSYTKESESISQIQISEGIDVASSSFTYNGRPILTK